MSLYRFGHFLIDSDRRLLLRGGELVPLPPKAFDLLLLLVTRGGRVVSKDEMLREVWPECEVVEEWNLTQHVYRLRSALGETKGSHDFIETVPRRGYRFSARVFEAGHEQEAQAAPAAVHPTFRQLTFRRGAVFDARFSPDGRSVLYAAAYEGGAPELYLADGGVGSPEPRTLGLRDAGLLAVSASGELAVSLGERSLRGYIRSGALARVPPFGGAAPRRLLDGVQEADFSPDGVGLVVVKESAGRSRIEYPPGHALYETGGWVSHPRFSPGGDQIAFIDHPLQNDDRGSVAVVDLQGRAQVISVGWVSAQGLAWSPSGDEVWFTAAKSGNARELFAVALDGRQHLVARMAGSMTLQDVSRDGTVLLTRQNTRVGIICRAPGADYERDLSWLDWSLARDLSPDGRTLLFTEAGEGGGATYGIYLRGTDGSPAVRLGDGSALALSPDGRWALSISPGAPAALVLLPTGAGEPKRLERAALSYQQWACWFPDGQRVLFTANEAGRGTQLFVQELGGSAPRCITPDVEGLYLTTPHAISPDGRHVAAVGVDNGLHLCGLEGGCEQVPGLVEGDAPVRWHPSGTSLYVYNRRELPAPLHLLDLQTGGRELVRRLMPPDPAGVVELLRVLLTPCAESYAYTYTRDLSDLFVVGGLG